MKVIGFIIASLAFSFFLFVVYSAGKQNALIWVDDMKEDAVSRGYAEWIVIDPRYGKSEFRWKEPKP